MNYRDILQKLIYHVIDPLIRLMLKMGITPNIVTAGGFVGNLVAMWLFLDAAQCMKSAERDPYLLTAWGGAIILAAGLFDMMDGRLARLGGLSSRFGALWDSTLDRYSELVTLFGICILFIQANWFWMGVLTFAAMVGSVMVSYVRARAEGLDIECKVGLMQRPERVVVTAVAAIIAGMTANLWWLAGGMILIAILANITAFWRIWHCYKILTPTTKNSTPLSPRRKAGSDVFIVLAVSLAFLLFQWLVVGLIPGHIIMVVLFNLLFFAHPLTRKLAMTLLPFVFFEISYDWMRLYPNYMANPIDIKSIYETEKALFGIAANGTTLIPCEYFNLHHSAVADLLAGLFYLCWVPGPIALAIWLFFKGERGYALRFTWAFLFVNLVGFAGYYLHPTAPPWYAINYGFEPDFTMGGNVAGLGRFDELVGIPVFSTIYVNNSNIYAALPSLHAAYMMVATIYAIISRQPKWLIAICCIITAGIWWTAVYSCHHYIIDVLAGILTAIIGIGLYELVLIRLKPIRRFLSKYTKYVS